MNVLRFEPRASLAHVSATPTGWVIDTRGPHVAQHYDFRSIGEAAEFALVLRDEGGWALRFSPAAENVRQLVDDLSRIASVGGAA